MKLLFPVVLALSVAACSSLKPEPKPGTAAHQQWLHEQAREHFLALKAEEQKSRPVARREPAPEPKPVAIRPFYKRSLFSREPKPTPTPSPQLATFRARKPQPTPAPQLANQHSRKPQPTPKPAPRVAETRPRQPDDTLYIWNAPRQQEPTTQRFTKGEIRYARELAKSPENLTSEERLWARRRYR